MIDENSVNGQVVQHNVCRISKTGVVSLIDKTGKKYIVYVCFVYCKISIIQSKCNTSNYQKLELKRYNCALI